MPLPEDKLTKLIHEDELEDVLTYEIARAKRYRWDLSALLIEPEVDSKIRQEVYPVLKHLATLCHRMMRVVDKGIRHNKGVIYILPETPFEGSKTVANKIQEKFNESLASASAELGLPPSRLKVGITTFEGSKESDEVAPTWRQFMVELYRQLR